MIRRRFQIGALEKGGRTYRLRYRVDIIGRDGTVGCRERKSVPFGKVTKQQAIRLRDEFIRRHGITMNRPKATMTLGEFWNLHFEPNIVRKKSHYTQKLYAALFRNHIKPTFGDTSICEVTRGGIDSFLSVKLGEGYSPQTVHHIHELLSKMLGTAYKYRWIEENTASGVELPPIETVRPARALTLDEVGLIAKALPEPGRTVFMIGVIFGLRIGEILGLQVEDADFANCILWVRRSATRGVLNRVKGKHGNGRHFTIPPFAREILQRYLTWRKSDSSWLFPTRKGGFHNDRTFWIRFVVPHVSKLDIPHWSWHSMRHTFLTYNGNDADIAFPVLQSLAGHTKAQTTLKYIDPFVREKARALEAWAEKLSPLGPIWPQFTQDGTYEKSEVVQ